MPNTPPSSSAAEEQQQASTTSSSEQQPSSSQAATDDNNAGSSNTYVQLYTELNCPCPCHVPTAAREGRPWLGYSNTSYICCPLCWNDAYMRATGSEDRGVECAEYLRAHGKDPKIPAREQC
ncbi:hypothetical protein F5B20DRAFT_585995 [Whalleya microplaca]|nr:hypothetical protein F5B20DRAFT_585995 [Whalleya microplaca]